MPAPVFTLMKLRQIVRNVMEVMGSSKPEQRAFVASGVLEWKPGACVLDAALSLASREPHRVWV